MSKRQSLVLLIQIVWFVVLLAMSALLAVEYQRLGPAMTLVKGFSDWNATMPNTPTWPPTPNPTEFSATITAFWKPR